ncbi:hypothetical protein BDZ91DRAFT_745929 [Kalaharituber pfeilii]|nr:hypothetical protein BDZ91DRAFT_745929 [Kalaharituber pfeilii]
MPSLTTFFRSKPKPKSKSKSKYNEPPRPRRSLWKTYFKLRPTTRILIGAGIITYALAGMYLTNKAEEAFNMVPTEEDKKKLEEFVPKVRTVEPAVGRNTNVKGEGR